MPVNDAGAADHRHRHPRRLLPGHHRRRTQEASTRVSAARSATTSPTRRSVAGSPASRCCWPWSAAGFGRSGPPGSREPAAAPAGTGRPARRSCGRRTDTCRRLHRRPRADLLPGDPAAARLEAAVRARAVRLRALTPTSWSTRPAGLTPDATQADAALAARARVCSQALDGDARPAGGRRPRGDVLRAVADTAARWELPAEHFTTFLAAMRMDLSVTRVRDLGRPARLRRGFRGRHRPA